MADAFSTEENKNDFKIYLQEKGNKFEGIKAQPRVLLRDRDQSFF